MSIRARLLERPAVYRLWQAPFVRQKLAPLHRHNDLSAARRVLDIGCGPGTNTSLFAGSEYLGVDLSPAYTAVARERYGRTFVTADATTFSPVDGAQFDFVLVNSLLHHLNDTQVDRLLSNIRTLLAPDGHVHLLDLTLPERGGVARTLTLMDRGSFPRPLDRWLEMAERAFAPVVVEPYRLETGGTTLWQMIYFKGRA